MKPIKHHWIAGDIVGGNLALDLVNTVSGWNYDPEDWIPDIAGLLAWARVSGVLNEREKSKATLLAKDCPTTAERVLASVKELRFTLWSLVSSLQHRTPAKRGDLATINEWIRRLALSEQVVARRNKIDFEFSEDISVLDFPGLRVTAAAQLLLGNPPVGRLKTCPGRDCRWKFVDQSKNRSRRWCDMEVCGNLAKARQYRKQNN